MLCASILRVEFEPHELCLHILRKKKGLSYYLVQQLDLLIFLMVNDLGNVVCKSDGILSAGKHLLNAHIEDILSE
jgi:hypothetical protein